METSKTQLIVDLVMGLISVLVGALILAGIIKLSENISFLIGIILILVGLYYVYKAYVAYRDYKEYLKNNDK